MVLWLVVLVVAAGAGHRSCGAALAIVHDDAIDLTDGPALGVAGEALGLPTWADAPADAAPPIPTYRRR